MAVSFVSAWLDATDAWTARRGTCRFLSRSGPPSIRPPRDRHKRFLSPAMAVEERLHLHDEFDVFGRTAGPTVWHPFEHVEFRFDSSRSQLPVHAHRVRQ